eukprot:XP_001704765.1 Hypothetical protein GL50803_28619 [Giardia lamblia ATCC 50803]
MSLPYFYGHHFGHFAHFCFPLFLACLWSFMNCLACFCTLTIIIIPKMSPAPTMLPERIPQMK